MTVVATMSRLGRLFGKPWRVDDSSSEPDENLVSDTAENESSARDSDYSDGHSARDWTEWSVNNDSSKDEDDVYQEGDELASLNDLEGSKSTDDIKLPSPQSLSPREKLTEARMLKSESDLGMLKSSKRKKKKKSKDKSTGDASERGDDDSDKAAKKKKKSKKRSKSAPINDFDSVSLLSGSAGDSATISTPVSSRLPGDDASAASGGSLLKTKEKKKRESKSSPKKKKDKSKRKSKLDSVSLPGTPIGVEESDAGLSKKRSSKSRARSKSRSRSLSRTPPGLKRKGSKRDSKLSRSDHLPRAPLDITGPVAAIDPSLLGGGTDAQSQEILRLHQMLSDALQKVAAQSAEQINDKDQFLRVSTELSRIKADFEGVTRQRNDLRDRLVEREETVEKSMKRIDNLEEAIERQLDEQDRMEAKLLRSEDEVDKLLIEIQDLELGVDMSGGGSIDKAMRSELKELKKTMVDKQREIDDQKTRIEHLEQELTQSAAVSKLQVDELEGEKKALEGKIKGERLESSSKLALRDDTIARLETELSRYRGNTEYEEIAVVREELDRAKSDAAKASHEVDSAQRLMNKAKNEKDDLQEKNSALNDKVKALQRTVNELSDKSRDLGEKVLKWTEQTYEWKSKAEAAEKKIGSLADASDASDAGSAADEAPQGLFLQAVMDKRESNKKTNRWSIFGNGGEDEASADEIRIKTLETLNQKLESEITELKSEMVKTQTAHKEEAYTIQKKLSHLEAENEALALKNSSLETLFKEEE